MPASNSRGRRAASPGRHDFRHASCARSPDPVERPLPGRQACPDDQPTDQSLVHAPASVGPRASVCVPHTRRSLRTSTKRTGRACSDACAARGKQVSARDRSARSEVVQSAGWRRPRFAGPSFLETASVLRQRVDPAAGGPAGEHRTRLSTPPHERGLARFAAPTPPSRCTSPTQSHASVDKPTWLANRSEGPAAQSARREGNTPTQKRTILDRKRSMGTASPRCRRAQRTMRLTVG
jgi:hypothetical protein